MAAFSRNASCCLPLPFALLLVLCWPLVAWAENWPQWRGPRGDGSSSEFNLPLVWREDYNLVWKVPLPGWGNSTPIVWGEAVFVTAQQDDKLLLLRINKDDGKIVWRRQAGAAVTPRAADRGRQKFHALHNLASPSPVTDGSVVMAHFGDGLLAAFDFDGKQLWKRDLQKDYGAYTIRWGHANSPVMHEDVVVSVCMQDSLADVRDEPAASYLVAHHKRTGRVQWYVPRKTNAAAEEGDAYTTPVLRQVVDRVELLVMGGNQLDAYDPRTGKRLWYLPSLRGGRTVSSPVSAGKFVIVTRGKRGPLAAVRLSREHEGKIDRRSIAWETAEATPDCPSPAIWADLLFTVNDDGLAKCFDGRTGRTYWKRRLKGKYKASPVTAEGRVHFLNQSGRCTVVAAAPQFKKLVENELDDETLASPAISGKRFFIRGKKSLYCLGAR